MKYFAYFDGTKLHYYKTPQNHKRYLAQKTTLSSKIKLHLYVKQTVTLLSKKIFFAT